MLLEVRNLSRRFGTLKAVDDVSFTVEEGTICGFVGPNGAGKTTTMRIVAGLDEPTAGEVFIKGVSVQEYPERTSPHLGFMPDTFAKYPNLTTEEYLDFFAGAYGLRGKEKRERVEAIIEFLGLDDLRQTLEGHEPTARARPHSHSRSPASRSRRTGGGPGSALAHSAARAPQDSRLAR